MSSMITLIVTWDPGSRGSISKVGDTIKSALSHYQGPEGGMEFLVARPESAGTKKDEKIFSKLQKKFGKDFAFQITTEEEAKGLAKGGILLVLPAGTHITKGDIRKMADASEKAGVTVTEPYANEKQKLPNSGYLSIYAHPYRLENLPETLMLRNTEALDLALVLKGGLTAHEYLLKTLVTDEGEYFYRDLELYYVPKRDEGDLKDPEGMAERLMAHSREVRGYVTEFVQIYVLRLMAMKMKEHAPFEDPKKYLQDVSDDIIVTCKHFDVQQMIYILGKKNGRDIRKELWISDLSMICFGDLQIKSLNNSLHIKISISSVKDDTLILEGMTDIPYFFDGRFTLIASTEDGKEIPAVIAPLRINDGAGFSGETYIEGSQFRIEVPVKDTVDITLYLKDENGKIYILMPRMAANSRFSSRMPMSYFCEAGRIVKYEDCFFHVEKYKKSLHRKYERKYLWLLVTTGRPMQAVYRLLYRVDKMFQKKPVWIVMDRPHLAKDNGEHMFRYLQTTAAAKDCDVYFVLKKSSRDYERVKKIGKVLTHNSLKHRLKFLEAKVLIAAAANNLTINAFGNSGTFYRDLYDFDFIYLRHGVSHNDQSAWLHRLKKNMRILVATCRPEYEGILKGDYGYTEKNVKLTGLARYDNLYDEREKKIAILPTWRQNLEASLQFRSSKREYIPDFTDTDYFKFYNSLINDKRLLKTMKEHGYTGVFYLHPVFEEQFKDFKGNDIITVGKGVADYQQVFKESALMVTDFSSVAFDFAYLKKPVIYSQFDEETFYKYHAWGKGYFTYREDGFGPITTDLDETVETLISYIETGCEMKPEYVEKVDKFFAYTDRNNCKRIYEAILEAEKDR